ncbi:MAG: flagellar motor switch protein FliG [Bacillota bacterium]
MVRRQYTGAQKAAILLISLGPEVSARVFRHLAEEDIEKLTLEIAATRKVPPEVRDSVIEEFRDMCLAQDYLSQGGVDYAKNVLERALGTQKAMEILRRLTASLQVRPFDFIRRTDASQILNFIQNEHSQTIALIMAYMDTPQAAAVLSALPPERQADIAKRLARMDRTAPEVVREVERVLERKLSSLLTQEYSSAGGVQSLVDVLNRVDRATEKRIIGALEISDPELAEEVKKRMFMFEDIVNMDDRSLQRVLREVDMNKDLPLALKSVSKEVKDKIYRNVSKRAAEMLEENIQALGPVRLRDVEEAQQKIVNLIRRLEEEGEVIVGGGGGDDIVV